METFVARVGRLTDDERLEVAEARKAVDEVFHEKALRAALEALAGRREDYVRARRAVAAAHVPIALEHAPHGAERTHWNEVARLVQLALDDALLAIVARDVLHPNHLRELYRSVTVAFAS